MDYAAAVSTQKIHQSSLCSEINGELMKSLKVPTHTNVALQSRRLL